MSGLFNVDVSGGTVRTYDNFEKYNIVIILTFAHLQCNCQFRQLTN